MENLITDCQRVERLIESRDLSGLEGLAEHIINCPGCFEKYQREFEPAVKLVLAASLENPVSLQSPLRLPPQPQPQSRSRQWRSIYSRLNFRLRVLYPAAALILLFVGTSLLLPLLVGIPLQSQPEVIAMLESESAGEDILNLSEELIKASRQVMPLIIPADEVPLHFANWPMVDELLSSSSNQPLETDVFYQLTIDELLQDYWKLDRIGTDELDYVYYFERWG